MIQWHRKCGKEQSAALSRAASVVVPLLCGVLFFLAGCSGTKKGDEPENAKEPEKGKPRLASSASLNLVPADAPAFATIGLASWWNSTHGKRLQQQFAQLDPTAALEKILGVPPEQAERLTLVAPEKGEPYTVVAATVPYDRTKVLALLAPGAAERKVGSHSVFVNGKGNCVRFLDERTFLIGSQRSLTAALGQPAQGDTTKGPLQPALALANKHLAVVGVNPQFKGFQQLRQQKDNPANEALKPLLDASAARLTLDLEDDLRLDGLLTYADPAAAQQNVGGVKTSISVARTLLAVVRRGVPKEQEALAKPFFNFVDALLRTATTEQQQASVRVAVQSEKGSLEQLVSALIPAVQKVRQAATRTISANNLKQIGLAMHNHADTWGKLPAAAIYGRNGQPLLSWRVAILPFVEQVNLYKQFKLDEAWDSPHNLKLLPLMPKVYAPVAGDAGPNSTYYRVFTGPNTSFPGPVPFRFIDFRDGTSNTILVVEAGQAVPWTKPDELVSKPAGPLPQLGGMFKEGFNVLMADGSVRFVKRTVSDKTLRGAITPAGGEVLGPDW